MVKSGPTGAAQAGPVATASASMAHAAKIEINFTLYPLHQRNAG
jgi:hypothetical protein